MKQLSKAIALSCVLLSSAALLPTTAVASIADVYNWYSIENQGDSTDNYVDTAGHEAYITVTNDSWSGANVEVTWNGEAVKQGDILASGNSVTFHVNDSGTVSVKGLECNGDECWYYDAYGDITISII